MARGGGGGRALLLLRLVSRLAAPDACWLALVQWVRQGDQEGVRTGRAQRDGAGCPDHNLLRQRWRRGGKLKERGRKEVEGGEVVRLVKVCKYGGGGTLRRWGA